MVPSVMNFIIEFCWANKSNSKEPVLSLRPPCLKIIRKYPNPGISFFVVVVFPWLERAILSNMHGIPFQIL